MNEKTRFAPMPWFVRGDVDGFFGLALDNFVQLLLIAALCQSVLGFSNELLYARVLPGAAVSLVIGNAFYAWQARRRSAETGRQDWCSLPYGINTVSLIAHVFLVMLPAKLAATQAGAADPARVAWQAGLVATIGSGVIELVGSLVAERIRRWTPRAALLSTLAGIAVTFISLGFFWRTYARPIVGLTTLAVVLLTYFGRVRFRGSLPGGLVAVLLGTIIAWLIGIAPVGARPVASAGIFLPIPVLGDILDAFRGGQFLAYMSIILPMGLFNVVGSIQNLESAEAAGDSYDTRSSMMANGIGTIGAALFGSCFPTTIYIGHPGWKAMGARAGYSLLNAGAATIVCLTGTLAWIAWVVPIDAGMAIVLWIGIVITAQAFQAIPRKHAPAAVMGILPGLAAWSAFVAKSGLHAAGYGTAGGPPFTDELVARFQASDTWITGAFALEQGFIFTSMILAAATVAVIERRFWLAAVWCCVAAALSALGLMHSFQWTPGDTTILLAPAWPWAAGYVLMAIVFLSAHVLTVPDDTH